jgi:hypothetical protein
LKHLYENLQGQQFGENLISEKQRLCKLTKNDEKVKLILGLEI